MRFILAVAAVLIITGCQTASVSEGASDHGSRAEPVSLSEPVEVNDQDRGLRFRLTLVQVVRGEEADLMIEEALGPHMIEEVPADNEYLLARFRFEYLSGEREEPLAIGPFDFAAVSAAGVTYDRILGSTPEPELSKAVYPGGVHEGWVRFNITDGDTPLLQFWPDTVGLGLAERIEAAMAPDPTGNSIWFSIS